MPPLTRRLSKIPVSLRGYALAMALLGAMSGVTVLAYPHFKSPHYALSAAFLAAILALAWFGGFGAGLVATAYTIMVLPRLVDPSFTLQKVNWVSFMSVATISVLLSWAARSRAQLRAANLELDQRVRERTAELERANAALQERESLLLKQTEELARSNADLEQFAYVASHDLQEPLRMVAIYTELLARKFRGSLDAQSDGFVETILDGVHRLETLIRDLLAYSRTIHAEAPAPERVDASEAVQRAIERLEMLVREAGASVEVAPLPEVAGDGVALTQVFQNLLSNALKYRSDGDVRIRVTAEPDGRAWLFSVEDNGIGIHPDYHETVFEPFKRLNSRQSRGSGVGLAICRRIIERHGGRIWVESSPGQGSKFRFTVPQANGAVSKTQTLAANERP
ncbi:MAG TPA: ATP-binding protein [Bryobacteraceae bacterium]|nr:ATP-binding protein [Bryobacteraceae bacterium]